jgi:hypothetical protein
MNAYRDSATFVPIRVAARRLGVPAAWLEREALDGRVPYLRVGRKLMTNYEAVQRALLRRALEAWIDGQQELEIEG